MNNTKLLSLIIAVAALSLGACVESYNTYVEGVVQSRTGPDNPTFDVQGDLTTKDGDWYGYCRQDGDNFTFEVGNANKGAVSSTAQFYLYVENIVGPAQEGVYQDPAVEDPVYIDEPDDRYTEFTTVQYKNVNEWSLPWSSEEISSKCAVKLFSTPAYGELTPLYHTFELFVLLECNNLSGVTDVLNGTSTLDDLTIELWFERCD